MLNQSKLFDLNESEINVLQNYVVKLGNCYQPKENIEMIPIEEIKIVKNNPNKHTEEHIAEIVKSIHKYGLMVPVLKNNNNQLITGEGRYNSLKRMQCRYIATLTIENTSPEILRAYRIADNQLTRSTAFEYSTLKKEFNFLYKYKIQGTDLGFTALQVDQIYNYKITEPKPQKENKTIEEENSDWLIKISRNV